MNGGGRVSWEGRGAKGWQSVLWEEIVSQCQAGGGMVESGRGIRSGRREGHLENGE